jgi:hypothetical protein
VAISASSGAIAFFGVRTKAGVPRGLGRRMARPAAAFGRALGQEALHDPVLDGMERHDGKLAARLQRPFGRAQGGDQLAQLVVHRDAQRLERAGRGMALPRLLARQAGFDDPRQLQRGVSMAPWRARRRWRARSGARRVPHRRNG